MVEEARHHDPLERFATHLRETGVLDVPAAEALRVEVKEGVDAAIAAAWEAPDPLPESALRHVFAEEPTTP